MDKLSRVFVFLLKDELIITFRHRHDIVQPLIFFSMVMLLFPFAFGHNQELLPVLSAGVIWVACLLSMCLSLDKIFRNDFEDGTMEQWILSAQPLFLFILVKLLVGWLIHGIPLIVIALFSAYCLGLPHQILLVLLLTLTIGSFTLYWIGAIPAALTAGLRNNILLGLLFLPLSMPTLVLSVISIEHIQAGETIIAELSFLSGLFVLALVLAPILVTYSVKVRVGHYD